MAKLGSKKFDGTKLVRDQLYIEVRVEKMAEVRARFFIAKILIWLLKKVGPCKVEYKFYEQSGDRVQDSGAKGRGKLCKRN